MKFEKKRFSLMVLMSVLVLAGFAFALPAVRAAFGLVAPSSNVKSGGLDAVLNADGTLKAGAQGSFDASGYRMVFGEDGSPRFVAGPEAAGDDKWASGFGVLGVGHNTVNVIAVNGGDVYVGGLLSIAGNVSVANIAKWNGTAWSALGTGVNDAVNAIVVSGSDVYVGGAFTTAGGVSANRVAKWNGTTWSALGIGLNGAVNALAVSGSDLYVGGNFTTASGTTANRVAKWNGTGWSALGSGTDNVVYTLAVIGTNLYVGGQFTTAGGVTVNNIAKWNGTSWSALGAGINNGVNNVVRALVVNGGDLYVGGNFTTAGGATNNRVAKWDGTTWSALGTGVNNQVFALAFVGSDLYVGGGFVSANNQTATRIAKWNGTTWSKLGATGNDGTNGTVMALGASGSNLLVGGSFTKGGGVFVNHLATWDGTNWAALNVGPVLGVNSQIRTFAQTGSDLYAGGEFDGAGNVAANNIAKWNGTGWSALGAGVNNSVFSIAISGNDIYVGGAFTTAGGVTVNRIAKWDGTNWSALGTGMDATVQAIAVNGSTVYAGGSFTTAGGVHVNRIAKWDGTSWSALGTGMDSIVTCMTMSGSDLLVGGAFTTAGGVTVNRIAKWDGNSWSALGTGMDNVVSSLLVNGSDLYVGGSFTTAGGVSAIQVAKWDGTSWSAVGTGLGSSLAAVYALAMSGNNLYAGGTFLGLNGTTLTRMARWNGSCWQALGSGVSLTGNPSVGALAVINSDLYVGGFFSLAGDKPSSGFAKYDTTLTLPSISTHPASQTVGAGGNVTFSVTASNATSYRWRYNGANINGATSSSYTINAVNSGQAGTYDVVVSTGCDSVTSNAATLTVNLAAPTLGNYAAASVTAGGHTTITPSAAPANVTSATASAPGFGGVLSINPTTGVIRVSNAQSAGTYTVTVKAFGAGSSATKTFTLTVNNPFACTIPGFSGTTNISVGSGSHSVALGDFNGDGKLDFATANRDSNNVSIRLGDGAGAFSGTTEVGLGSNPYSIAVGDFNGDGKLDFATANTSSNNVSIRLGDGAGAFSGTTTVGVGTTPFGVAVGDFNGDGKLDFAAVNYNSNNVSIRLGDGAGAFSDATNVSVGSQPQSVTLGDFNGDGKLDFATANGNSNNISIRLGDGTGGFSGTTNVSVGTNPLDVAVGDFNGDGKLDFAAANHDSHDISIRLGDGAGAFSGTTTVSAGSRPYSVAVGDFNGDGKLDFAAANYSSDNVSIRWGDGAGNFTGTTNVSAGSGPSSVAVGDFNSDGKLDFAAANYDGGTVSIRLNSCTNNTAPSITVSSALARIQGTAASNATIATVSDTETAAGSLTVAATTVPAGITVTNIVNTNGTITADVAAGCTAAVGANTIVLTVTDGGSLTATANLTVNVTSGTASISTPPATQTATAGQSVTLSVTASNATGYQWRKGGNPINGATASSYTLNPVNTGDADSYDVVVTGVCGNATSTAATLTVNKASQTITFGTLAAKTWGDAAFTVGATASSNLAVSYSIVSGPATINGNTVTLTGIGTVTIRASQAGNTEYNAATDVDQSFTVNKATLTVTAADKTKVYGAAIPTLTYSYSGWVNSDTEASLTGAPRLVTSASNSSHVGSYDITILPGTLNAANYLLNFVGGKLTVTPAPLTVTAESYSRAYGTENPAFTATFNGLVNGDTMNLTAGTATLTTSALPNSPVGSYAIVPSGINNPDYTVTYVPGTLTITAVPATLKVNASLTPSALGQSVTFTVSAQATTPYGGMPSGPLVFLVDGKNPKPFVLNAAGQASITLATLEIGTHTILASYSGDNNYQSGTKEFTQEVTKAASWTTLTALANPISVGQRVTLIAKVRSSASQPQGEVEFWSGTQSLGKATLTNGVANLTSSDLPEGTHVLKAVYLGNEACSRSTSNELSQQVTTGCTFTLPQKEFLVGTEGGSVNVMLEAKASCFWTVGLPPSWIEVWSPDIVNGQWVTKLIVAPNAGANVRVAKITFAGQEVTITQSRPMSSVHAASYTEQGISGNSIASIFGTGLAGQTEAASSQPLPKQLANVRVKVRDSQGQEEWADLLFVSEGQINYVVPGGMAEGEFVVTVVRDEVAVSASKHLLESVSPGIFSADSSGQGPAAAQIQRVYPDGAQSFAATSQYNTTTKRFEYVPITLNTSTNLVADETYLVLFGTGWRNCTSLQNVRAVVGGQDAQVVYAGEQPNYAGLDQVNILLPQSLAGAGVVEVILYVEGKASNVVKIHVQ